MHGSPGVGCTNVFSHWIAKGPHLNFIIQPDTADQPYVLTPKNRIVNPADEGWLLAPGGWREEVVERGGYTFPSLFC